MKFLRTATSIAIALLIRPSAVAAADRSAPVLVRAVVSGDRIDVSGVGHVRLAGIRAPRLVPWAGGSEPWAEDARRRLASVLVSRWVRLERVPGRAGGSTVYVWTEDGVLVNALMLREGLAQLSTEGRVPRADELASAEADARAARRGIWSGGRGSPHQPDAITRKAPGSRSKAR